MTNGFCVSPINKITTWAVEAGRQPLRKVGGKLRTTRFDVVMSDFCHVPTPYLAPDLALFFFNCIRLLNGPPLTEGATTHAIT